MKEVFRCCSSYGVNLLKVGENFSKYRENRAICHGCTRVASNISVISWRLSQQSAVNMEG